jgi:hypothetical protein
MLTIVWPNCSLKKWEMKNATESFFKRERSTFFELMSIIPRMFFFENESLFRRKPFFLLSRVNSHLSTDSHPGASALTKTRLTENPEKKDNFTQILCAIRNASI